MEYIKLNYWEKLGIFYETKHDYTTGTATKPDFTIDLGDLHRNSNRNTHPLLTTAE